MITNCKLGLVRRLNEGLLLVLILSANTKIQALSPSPIFVPLGDLPGEEFYSIPYDVSADGLVVVGESEASSGGEQAFRWTVSTGMVALGDLDGPPFSSEALGVSANGSVSVGRTIGKAVKWDGLSIGSIANNPPNINSSSAWGVSDTGDVIVGQFSFGSGFAAFRWTEATGMVDIVDLPGVIHSSLAHATSGDGEVVVGYAQRGGQFDAFRWTAADGTTILGDFPGGGYNSVAYDVSSDGQVIVGRAEGTAGSEAFRWTAASGLVGLGDFSGGGSYSSLALGVSADGSVIVGSGEVEDGNVACIWDVHGMRSIQDMLTSSGVDLTGWRLLQATGISNDGNVIVGVGTNPLGNTEGWLVNLSGVVVPEPSSGRLVMVSVLVGLLLLTMRR